MKMNAEQFAYYIEYKGLKCPFCKSEKHTVEATGRLEIDGSTGVQTAECSNCKATWGDLYELVGTVE